MTQDQIKQLLDNIARYADLAAGTATQFLPPQYLVPVVIGKALIDLVPTLEADVANMIAGNPPTPEQDAATNAKLQVLRNPDGL